MPMVRVIDRDATERELQAPSGATLMEPLRDMDDGVAAICGGMCSCATCHVYVDPCWLPRLEPREEMEEGMLETAWEPRENSRLSCQVHITAQLDGLQVTVPQRQGQEPGFVRE